MTLPTFKDASERVRNGTATNLDRFIWNFEPHGKDDELFREQLAYLLGINFGGPLPVEKMKPECAAHNEYMDQMYESKA